MRNLLLAACNQHILIDVKPTDDRHVLGERWQTDGFDYHETSGSDNETEEQTRDGVWLLHMRASSYRARRIDGGRDHLLRHALDVKVSIEPRFVQFCLSEGRRNTLFSTWSVQWLVFSSSTFAFKEFRLCFLFIVKRAMQYRLFSSPFSLSNIIDN